MGKSKKTGEIIEKTAPIVVFDYDFVLNPDTEDYADDVSHELRAEIDYLRKSTFCEILISGKDLHAILWDTLPEINVGLKNSEGKTELYSENRFFAFTGLKCPESPKTIEKLDILLEIYSRRKLEKKIRIQTSANTGKIEKQGKKKDFLLEGLIAEEQEWFLSTHKTEDILYDAGTHLPAGDSRGIYTGSTTGSLGLIINEETNTVYSHHAGDPLPDGRVHDTIDAKILSCKGERQAAAKSIKEADQGKQAIAAIPEDIRKDGEKIYKSGKTFRYLLDTALMIHKGEKDDTLLTGLLLSLGVIYVNSSEGIYVTITGPAQSGKTHACDTVL